MSQRILHPNPVQLFKGMWASGIFTNLNVYWPCQTNCRYCYVRHGRLSSKKPLGMSGGPYDGLKTFSNLIGRALGPGYDDSDPIQFFLRNHFPMMVANNSDPFTACEVTEGMTYQYLEILADIQQPLQILTKLQAWPHLDRDRYIALLKRFEKLWVSVTLGTRDAEFAKFWESGAPSPAERLAAVRELTDVGIDVVVHCVPHVPEAFPGEPFDPDTYRPFCEAVKAAGARAIFQSSLHLEKGRSMMGDPDLKAFVAQHASIKSKPDAPWHWWVQDVEYERQVAEAFGKAARAVGLDFAGHQCNGSLIDHSPNPSRLGVPPEWVDLSASWGKAVARLRQRQQERGGPIVTNSWDLSQFVMEGVTWADHPFRKTRLTTLIPYDKGDPSDVARFNALPKSLTARQLIGLQNASVTGWSDSVWCDRAVSPLRDEAHEEGLVTEEGDPYLVFDITTPRDAWASCRAGHGWSGRRLSELSGATEWFSGMGVTT